MQKNLKNNIMSGLVNTFNTAVKSRLEYKKDLTEEQKRRLSICKVCPYNSDNKKELKFKDIVMIYLNRIINFILRVHVTEEAICTLCGCQLIHKSSQEDNEHKCELGKWK